MILWIGTCCSTTWNTMLGSLVHQHRNPSPTQSSLIPKCPDLSSLCSLFSVCILSVDPSIDQLHSACPSMYSLSVSSLLSICVFCLSNVSSVCTLLTQMFTQHDEDGWSLPIVALRCGRMEGMQILRPLRSSVIRGGRTPSTPGPASFARLERNERRQESITTHGPVSFTRVERDEGRQETMPCLVQKNDEDAPLLVLPRPCWMHRRGPMEDDLRHRGNVRG
jgi:hypothetical protein